MQEIKITRVTGQDFATLIMKLEIKKNNKYINLADDLALAIEKSKELYDLSFVNEKISKIRTQALVYLTERGLR